MESQIVSSFEQMEVTDRKGSSMLSKKRFQQISEMLAELFEDDNKANEAIAKIKDIMHFDPDVSRYTSEMGQKTKEYRNRLKEEKGISTYISAGTKKRYDNRTIQECKNYLCGSNGHSHYNDYCIRCFVHLFPDNQVVKRYKTKEASVVAFIKASFPTQCTVFDRSIDGGCSRYRPDIFMDCLSHSVIVEVDENQHDSYDCTCENKRMMTIFTDLGSRPLVMIRFNPDNYLDTQGNSIKSCFNYNNKPGLPRIRNEKDWNGRLKVLQDRITHHLSHVPEQEVVVEHLFYDGFE